MVEAAVEARGPVEDIKEVFKQAHQALLMADAG
jgi:hypothetical protein